jgi:hypothetical protein
MVLAATAYEPNVSHWVLSIVRLHFADLKRALFGQGSYELECAFQHLYVSHTYGPAKQQQKKKISPPDS